MIIKKTVIFMGYTCNNNCIFCCNSHKRGKILDKSTYEIKKDIINSKKDGAVYLQLTGGEPTIRKDIFEIVSFAKKIGFEKIKLTTNGRMFANKEFAKKMINAGVDQIIFSIHGHNAQLQDSLTKTPGNFEQLLIGINNLQKLGFKNIGSNTIIIKHNYKNLLDIGRLIDSLGIRNSEFIFVDPTNGMPKYNFLSIVPTYDETSLYINELLKFGKNKNIKHWHIRYYPLCFIEEKYHDMISEIDEKNKFYTKHLAPDFINEDVILSRKNIARQHIKKCDSCKYLEICDGYWSEYVKQNLDYDKKQIFSKGMNHNVDVLALWIPLIDSEKYSRPPFPQFAMLIKDLSEHISIQALDLYPYLKEIYCYNKNNNKNIEFQQNILESIKKIIINSNAKIILLSLTPVSNIFFSIDLIKKIRAEHNVEIIFYSYFRSDEMIRGILSELLKYKIFFTFTRQDTLNLINKIKKDTKSYPSNFIFNNERLFHNKFVDNPIIFDYENFRGFNIKNYNSTVHVSSAIGCLNKCKFCMHNSCVPFKKFGLLYLQKQINHLNDLYSIQNIKLKDSLLNPYLKEHRETINFLIKQNNSVDIQIRVDNLSEQVINQLNNKNLRIFTGIESIHSNLLKFYNKSSDSANYIRSVKKIISLIKTKNIKLTLSYILGAPIETLKTIESSLFFLQKSKSNNIFLDVYPLQIKPSTDLYYHYKKNLLRKTFNIIPYLKENELYGHFKEIHDLYKSSNILPKINNFGITYPFFLVTNPNIKKNILFKKLNDVFRNIDNLNNRDK